MRDEAKYVNHAGVEVPLNGGPFRLNSGELQDWSLEPTVVNGRASSFSRARKEIALSGILAAGSGEDGASAKDALYEAAAADVEAMSPGRLYVGDWYVEGYVISSSKDRYWIDQSAADYELVLSSDDPMWTREHAMTYSKDRGEQGDGLNFPFDYPHDFGTSSLTDVIENPSASPAPLTITIFGPCSNPKVSIGGNSYEVGVEVEDGGMLVIDGRASRNPTITLVGRGGTRENVFGKRRGNQRKGGGSYVFERVPSGTSRVSWDRSFSFRVVLYERRDERRWG